MNIGIFGITGAIIFFIKVILHLYLLAKVNKKSGWHVLIPTSSERLQTFFHFYEDAPKGYGWLKKTINSLYAVSVLLILIFLISKR